MSQSNKKRVVVIGGAGFIGTNLVLKLLEEGHRVTVVDNLSRKGTEHNLAYIQRAPNAPSHLTFHRLDITDDHRALIPVLEGSDAVFLLAAQVAVTTSLVDPLHDFRTNAQGSIHVLEAIRACQSRPVCVYASTNKVYGHLDLPSLKAEATRYVADISATGIPETQPLDFYSPYGCSKGAADCYFLDYARIYGLKTVVARQSCIYGEYQYGIEDQGWIAWMLIASLLGRDIKVFGDGKQVRDALHVDDLVRFYITAMNHTGTDHLGQAFNIGGGPAFSLSVKELLDRISAMRGRAIPYALEAERPGDQKIYISDISKAKRILGWAPQIDVNTGLKRVDAWLAAHIGQIEQVLTARAA